MKKILFLVSVILLSCSKDDPKSGSDVNVPVGDKIYDQEGVTIRPEAVDFEVVQYNTRMDTTRVIPDMVLNWGVAVAEGDSVLASWTVPPTFKYSLTITDFEPSVEGVIGIALEKKQSGRRLAREQKVKVSRVVKNFDVFRVNFGMSKDEVKANELARLITTGDKSKAWLEKTATIAFVDAPNEPYLNGYEFENGKLKYIHVIQNATEVSNTDYMSSDIKDMMIALAKRYNAPAPVFEEKKIGNEVKYKTNSKISWVVNGLKVTYGLKTLPVQGTNLSYYTLTYEKQ